MRYNRGCGRLGGKGDGEAKVADNRGWERGEGGFFVLRKCGSALLGWCIPRVAMLPSWKGESVSKHRMKRTWMFGKGYEFSIILCRNLFLL